MKVHVAPVDARAAACIGDLHGLCFEDGWSADAVGRILLMPGTRARLALVPTSDSAVGFIIWRIAADEAEIITLGVVPEARRQGVAGELIGVAEAAAAAAGARRLYLEVATDNVAARTLYADRGYHPVGERPAYYRGRDGRFSDALIMMRSLPEPTEAAEDAARVDARRTGRNP